MARVDAAVLGDHRGEGDQLVEARPVAWRVVPPDADALAAVLHGLPDVGLHLLDLLGGRVALGVVAHHHVPDGVVAKDGYVVGAEALALDLLHEVAHSAPADLPAEHLPVLLVERVPVNEVDGVVHARAEVIVEVVEPHPEADLVLEGRRAGAAVAAHEGGYPLA
ncbi:hypothetical protein ES707_19026 [subsurface metagenome]